jgi:dUTP pyrophosphatase
MSDEKHDIDLRQKEIMQQFKEVTMQIWKEFVAKYSEPIKVKFKKLQPEAHTPRKATPGACCYDIVGIKEEFIDDHTIRWHTGLALEIPYGYKGNIYSRSSVYKTDSFLINGVGKIDSDFRGEVCFIFHVFNQNLRRDGYKPGDRIGQLEIERDELVEFIETQCLSETARGEGGFGSTGK